MLTRNQFLSFSSRCALNRRFHIWTEPRVSFFLESKHTWVLTVFSQRRFESLDLFFQEVFSYNLLKFVNWSLQSRSYFIVERTLIHLKASLTGVRSTNHFGPARAWDRRSRSGRRDQQPYAGEQVRHVRLGGGCVEFTRMCLCCEFLCVFLFVYKM